ncbi:basic proline-rich protein-like [Molothrus ater]|uniref:basic proline-rich protein-like n=1 Tax=Molothrus ater TaxID=84834 RepID=UPI00174BD980|nr:basic proline-rich protein-like [Molothrus ater]
MAAAAAGPCLRVDALVVEKLAGGRREGGSGREGTAAARGGGGGVSVSVPERGGRCFAAPASPDPVVKAEREAAWHGRQKAENGPGGGARALGRREGERRPPPGPTAAPAVRGRSGERGRWPRRLPRPGRTLPSACSRLDTLPGAVPARLDTAQRLPLAGHTARYWPGPAGHCPAPAPGRTHCPVPPRPGRTLPSACPWPDTLPGTGPARPDTAQRLPLAGHTARCRPGPAGHCPAPAPVWTHCPVLPRPGRTLPSACPWPDTLPGTAPARPDTARCRPGPAGPCPVPPRAAAVRGAAAPRTVRGHRWGSCPSRSGKGPAVQELCSRPGRTRGS